jgi:alpha-mannosidase
LSREISWPELPSRVATPAETRSGTVRMGLEAPRHIPELQAQVVPGDAELRACVRRMLFHVEQVGADPAAGAEAARLGLRAWAEGDYAGVKAAMTAFEQALAKSLPDRSSHQAILVGHGHIDMNWLWTSSETLQCCHDMFRQVLTFMDEFPQFHFSQSQASTYRYIELHDPAMFERIRQRVKEGRWELLGGAVTEGDTNLSSGEGIVRTLLYGQRYFQSRFGKRAKVGWLPDNFGHVAQLPQLLNLAGMKYFYGFRCQPARGTYRWGGIDGSQTLNFTTPTYNGAVTPELREIPEQYDPKHKKAMWVYGVGDHGGGPSRRDITRALDYQASAGFPKIEFGKAEDFFKSVEPHAGDYPVYAGELQYIFEGCYTSIARIKEANRRCENTLYAAELLSALNSLAGEAYPG